jgi:hypothetical protein
MDVRAPPFAAYLRDYVQRAASEGQVRPYLGPYLAPI